VKSTDPPITSVDALMNKNSELREQSDTMTLGGELASKLRCHPATIHRLVKQQKKIRAFKVGFDWRFQLRTLLRDLELLGDPISNGMTLTDQQTTSI
jgi:hypothetical protein